jgi:hypothetical protein
LAEWPSSKVESFADTILLSVKFEMTVGFDFSEEEAEVVAKSMLASFESSSRLWKRMQAEKHNE